MHLQFAFIAWSATRDENGLLSADGIGPSILRVDPIPATIPEIVVPISVQLSPEELGHEHEIAITMACPDPELQGDRVQHLFKRDPIEGDIRPHWYETAMITIQNVELPVTGTYELRISLDGQHVHSIYFEVIWTDLGEGSRRNRR